MADTTAATSETREKKGKDDPLNRDPEVIAARKRRAIAEAELAEAKAKDEKKKLDSPKSKLDKRISHAEKETKYFKAEVEHHQAKHVYKEHASIPAWKIILGIMVVILVLFAVAAMNQQHPSPGLAHAQFQVKHGAWALLNWLGALGVIVFLGTLVMSSAKKQKKSASGGGGTKHH